MIYLIIYAAIAIIAWICNIYLIKLAQKYDIDAEEYSFCEMMAGTFIVSLVWPIELVVIIINAIEE